MRPEEIKIMWGNGDKKSIKAMVIVIHGFGEHCGSYKELAERLAEADYASVIFNQRGHGDFPGYPPEKHKKLRGVIPGYQSFLDDIYAAVSHIKQNYPKTPVILYGHSMGGNIAANYLLAHDQSDFLCAVLESPWFGLYKELNPAVYFIASVLGRISPKLTAKSNLSNSDLTSDEIKAEEIKNDPLYHNRISLRMLSGIKKACGRALKNAARFSVPIYLAYAEHEKIVCNQAIKKFHASCKSNVILKEYDSRHVIRRDINRNDFYKDIISFFDDCLK